MNDNFPPRTPQAVLDVPTVKNAGAKPATSLPSTLQALLGAVEVMQDRYFEIFTGGWPTSIDWTGAVLGTHVSATLSSVVSSIEYSSKACSEVLAWENIVDKYFAHTSVFYFGQNDFALRNEAYDDMLWVVLGWLENIKFMHVRSDTYWQAGVAGVFEKSWHGMQFSASSAHRARIFYDLATDGWDESLCHGGMNWNPQLTPYKNAITNQLFISSSVAMFLYFPGDNNRSPFLSSSTGQVDVREYHDSVHLVAAVNAYKWLDEARMQNSNGLYADGYHVRGWRKYPNGTIDPGTGECDELNQMVYTYNQGVILTADRGLWIALQNTTFLKHGHRLINDVIKATGWQTHDDDGWHGLGRDGVLEEYCDHNGDCSQDGQSFKGIFFHHLADFCRPLWSMEESFIQTEMDGHFDRAAYRYHQLQCVGYGAWVAHNAHAALVTRDNEGRFGMWWGRQYPDIESQTVREQPLGADEVDYRNAGIPDRVDDNWSLKGDEHRRWTEMRRSPRQGRDEGVMDVNDRGRGRTVETQSSGLAVLRALWQWETLGNAHSQ